MTPLPFDEIRLKLDTCWEGSIKIVLMAKDSSGNEFLLKRIDKNFDYGAASEGLLGLKMVHSTSLMQHKVNIKVDFSIPVMSVPLGDSRSRMNSLLPWSLRHR
jgi:hypothetical protein